MSIIFSETIFPPQPKKIEKEVSYAGGFEFWFEDNNYGSRKLMTTCPKCATIFCLQKTVINEKITKIAVRTQGYYYQGLIKKNCPYCNDNRMFG